MAVLVLVGGGETATRTGWELAARDGERRCDPWTLGIPKSGKKNLDPHGGGTQTQRAHATRYNLEQISMRQQTERDGVIESFARALTCNLPAPQFAASSGRDGHLTKDSSCCCCCSSRQGLEFQPRDAYSGIAVTATAAWRQHCSLRRRPRILGENIKQVKEINCVRRILLPPGAFY
jgi:hypothetical protein